MAEVREPPSGEWPEVRTGGPAPDPEGVWVEEGVVLVRSPEVIAHGSVTGIPWKIQAWVTAPAPGAKWWEVMRAVGPEMAFHLGARGFLGGGGIHARVPEGHAFTASGHFFGRVPHVISWAGVVTEHVERLEVRLRDRGSRDVPLRGGPEGFPRFFWFFPPRGVSAAILAYGGDGRILDRARLHEAEVSPDENAGTSVNASGWPEGGPPPGWPDDDRAFAPGEGPRREEDFLLHIAPFPIYVLPPEGWEGLAMHSGDGGVGHGASYIPARIEFCYLDRAGEPTRGLEVVSVAPEEEDRLEALYPPHREEGIWRFDAGDDGAYLPQLPGRFPRAVSRQPSRRSRLSRGRRYLGRGRVSVAGVETDFERWEYEGLPELIEIRFRLSGVALRVEGWNLSVEEVLGYTGRLEQLRLGSDLVRRMEEANDAARRAWEDWHR